MEFKNILLAIVFSFCALAFLILIGFSVYNLYNTLAPSWGMNSSSYDTPSISGTCQKFNDNYNLTVSINNYDKEIKDVKCELASKGGMTSDKDQILLSIISPNSSDICDFVLTGTPTNFARVRVAYSKKGFWGYKNFSTIVDPYPSCSETVDKYPGYLE